MINILSEYNLKADTVCHDEMTQGDYSEATQRPTDKKANKVSTCKPSYDQVDFWKEMSVFLTILFEIF